ncbi:MAG: hypothetical protein Q7S08_03210 [bacterium]|nr:hypothetical protein [bacterium]
MSDSEIPTSAPPASDAPALEAIPTDVIAAPPLSADTVPAVSADVEAPVAPLAPLSDSPADTPAEVLAPEHTNILENVGMSVEPTETASSSSAPVPDNSSSLIPPREESPAPIAGGAYATLLSLRDKALNAIQFRRQARLEKIMALAAKKKSIGNDDVEKLLRVSDSTATRYLSVLVRDGKLTRTGFPQAAQYSIHGGSNGAV